MKKFVYLLFSIFVFSSVSTYGQRFELTTNGFVDSQDKTKDYVVLTFPGKTKQELYEGFLTKFNTMFVSSKDVISKAENNSISLNGIESGRISYNGFYHYKLNYTMSFAFKDEKTKINISINKISGNFGDASNYKELLLQGSGGSLFSYQYIWNNKGKLIREKQKKQLEDFFNEMIEKSIPFTQKDNW